MFMLKPLWQRYLVSEVFHVRFAEDGKLLVMAGIDKEPKGLYIFTRGSKPFMSIVSKGLSIRYCDQRTSRLLIHSMEDQAVLLDSYKLIPLSEEDLLRVCEFEEGYKEYEEITGAQASYVLALSDVVLFFGADGVMRMIKSGKIMKNIDIGAIVIYARVCEEHLILVTPVDVLVVELNDYKVVKKIEFEEVEDWAFSPDCKYIAVADSFGHSIRIHKLPEGHIVARREYLTPMREDFDNSELFRYTLKPWREPRSPLSIDWYDNLIAVGTSDGMLYVYEVYQGSTP